MGTANRWNLGADVYDDVNLQTKLDLSIAVSLSALFVIPVTIEFDPAQFVEEDDDLHSTNWKRMSVPVVWTSQSIKNPEVLRHPFKYLLSPFGHLGLSNLFRPLEAEWMHASLREEQIP